MVQDKSVSFVIWLAVLVSTIIEKCNTQHRCVIETLLYLQVQL